MRLRGSEVTALQAVLNEEHDDEPALCKALFETVLTLLEERDSYGIGWHTMAIGPIYDKRQADKLCAAIAGAASPGERGPFVARLQSVAVLKQGIAEAEAPHDPKHCGGCGHPALAHGFSNHLGCVVRGCKCSEGMK